MSTSSLKHHIELLEAAGPLARDHFYPITESRDSFRRIDTYGDQQLALGLDYAGHPVTVPNDMHVIVTGTDLQGWILTNSIARGMQLTVTRHTKRLGFGAMHLVSDTSARVTQEETNLAMGWMQTWRGKEQVQTEVYRAVETAMQQRHARNWPVNGISRVLMISGLVKTAPRHTEMFKIMTAIDWLLTRRPSETGTRLLMLAKHPTALTSQARQRNAVITLGIAGKQSPGHVASLKLPGKPAVAFRF